MRRAVFLDRDGTLIDVVRDEEVGVISVAFHPAQLRLLPGVVEGLRKLAGAGYVLAIATNQPGPAKGQFSRAAVERTNEALVAMLAEEGVRIEKVAACLHHPVGGPSGDASLVGPCECRKPRPGMLDSLVKDLDVDRASSWMVGDSRGDIEAGRAAKMKTALLFSKDRCELCPMRGGPGCSPDVSGPGFADVVKGILGE